MKVKDLLDLMLKKRWSAKAIPVEGKPAASKAVDEMAEKSINRSLGLFAGLQDGEDFEHAFNSRAFPFHELLDTINRTPDIDLRLDEANSTPKTIILRGAFKATPVKITISTRLPDEGFIQEGGLPFSSMVLWWGSYFICEMWVFCDDLEKLEELSKRFGWTKYKCNFFR